MLDLDGKRRSLLAKAQRALGENPVREAVAKVRAIVGPMDIPADEADAQRALDKLRKAEVPTPRELTALEIVIRGLRPVLFSRSGQFVDLPEASGHNLHTQEYKDLWADFRKQVAPLLYSVGRIEFTGGRHVGTGFLVRDGLLATNRHVLDVLTCGSEVLQEGKSRVVFKQECGQTNPADQIIALDGVAAIHPSLDMALLSLRKSGRPVVEIAPDPPVEGMPVAAIGYPGDDPVNNPTFLGAVFNGCFGYKGAALGEILEGSEAPTLFHDCSTTQGNSGSPIFSLANGRVVGIHRAGYFMYRNEGVDAASLRAFVDPFAS